MWFCRNIPQLLGGKLHVHNMYRGSSAEVCRHNWPPVKDVFTTRLRFTMPSINLTEIVDHVQCVATFIPFVFLRTKWMKLMHYVHLLSAPWLQFTCTYICASLIGVIESGRKRLGGPSGYTSGSEKKKKHVSVSDDPG